MPFIVVDRFIVGCWSCVVVCYRWLSSLVLLFVVGCLLIVVGCGFLLLVVIGVC